ncbi:MAG: bifunctional diaminohydroxyphosphoribosylaminopyrimidine deaminase/5-amino-6-(5-phosphoribosylamino)uracil reductase RibD [Beijerinckiaceae bacterium]|nr:bifunctional diaminohydroxyphosphoribosylaminopyrimidine deaminase/5-amino-6-(5-phosphoribosylamino)uracil reductase RibD [Beijerinckiaceae bacterium]
MTEPQRTAAQQADESFMRAALAIGRRGLGVTAPNPAVGTIIVKDGRIVGRGATQQGGRPHAETVALAEAGDKAQGGTAYVTLEPCSHHGVTGPCADALSRAGVKRVVSAVEDPDPRVAGRGHQMLRDAGVEVLTGVCVEAARRANLGHILRVTEGRPMVTLKLAETPDGFAAAGSPHDPRLIITGLAANNRVQVMRSMHDAIMVGVGTVLGDDPLLTVRLPGLEHCTPLRVVLDTHLRIPTRSRVVATAGERPLLVIAGEKAPASARKELEARGVSIEIVESGPDGHIDLRAALGVLARGGLTRVFSEGGPQVGGKLIQGGLADDVYIMQGAKPLGRMGIPALNDVSRAILRDPTRYRQAGDFFAGVDHVAQFERVL